MTISEVRSAYAALRERCLVEYPEQADYIRGLWAVWDAELGKVGDDTRIDRPYLDHLTRVIADPELSRDAGLEWLDAYPDAIKDRMGRALG